MSHHTPDTLRTTVSDLFGDAVAFLLLVSDQLTPADRDAARELTARIHAYLGVVRECTPLPNDTLTRLLSLIETAGSTAFAFREDAKGQIRAFVLATADHQRAHRLAKFISQDPTLNQ